MVTVRNDIEMMTPAVPGGTKVKDVNLKQEAKPVRRRSYRCITIVGVLALLLLSLAVGSVLLIEYVLKEGPTENSTNGSPSSTIRPEDTAVHQQSVPAFADPFDGMTDQPEIDLDPVDDDEIDIDGTPSTTTTTARTAEEQKLIDEGSGDSRIDDDDEDEYQYSSGSGSGDDDLW